MLRRFVCLSVLSLIASACARELPPPLPPAGADTNLPIETRIIEALVPNHATLETLLRDNALPATLVQAAIESARPVFDPRHLRAARPYRLVLSVDGFLKEFE